jgi:hypothetical protein
MGRLSNGTRVRTTEDAGSGDWSNPNRPDAKWGVTGTVIAHSDSHGLVYEVEHDCGGIGWYEIEELFLLSPESGEINQSTAGFCSNLGYCTLKLREKNRVALGGIYRQRLVLLDKIANLLKQHENDTDDMNLTGCIVTFDEDHYEYDGRLFEKWEGWEIEKIRKKQ